MPSLPHAKKPDLDNCFKAVADALTGVLWTDDAQIYKSTICKRIAAGGERPGVLIRAAVTELCEPRLFCVQ